MTKTLAFAAAALAAGAAWQAAYAVDPDVGGPVRRGAATIGSPAAQERIEQREQLRDLRRADIDPNAAARANARAANNAADWRMRYHNNEWWYYTPRNRWMYYRNNNWANYEANTYLAPRYSTGYRGLGGRGVYGPPTTAAEAGGATAGTITGARGPSATAPVGNPIGPPARIDTAGEPAIAPPAVRATAPAPVPAPRP